jgi:hypothetical protein
VREERDDLDANAPGRWNAANAVTLPPRIGFNTGIDYADELPRFTFIWLIFCGAVVALKQNTHINVKMFVHMVSWPVQKLFYGRSTTML